MKNNQLCIDKIFNPISYVDRISEEELTYEKERELFDKLKEFDTDAYKEIVEGLKEDLISLGINVTYSSKEKSTFIDYDKYTTNNQEIDPVFKELIPLLQKQINKGLKDLGLLPSQQINMQKITIVKRLRQRLISMEQNGKKLEIDAVVKSKL